MAVTLRILRRTQPLVSSRRLLCSEPSSSSSPPEEGPPPQRSADNLGRRLLGLKYPKRSAAATIRKWLEQGNTVHKHHLFRIVRQLRDAKRFHHALEVCEWAASNSDLHLQPGDYSIQLDLIAKVHGLAIAEKFFNDLPEQMKTQSTYTSLLHTYIQNNLLSKAESTMDEMVARGLVKSHLPYNLMINLYLTNGLLDKVSKMMEELQKNASPDVVTYNMLLTACAASGDIKGAEKIFVEMNVPADWITYSILAKLYIGNGMLERARKTLKEMEELVSKENRKAYCSLLTILANLGDKDGLNRVWDNMKSTFRKMSDAEYTSMIACLLKVRDLETAESIYAEWESVSGTKETKVSNILLSGYTLNGMMDKAEKFIEMTERKGIRSNYSTWQTMAWGYLVQNKMDDVIRCLGKAFESLKKWKPDDKVVKAVFDKLEASGSIEAAEQFLLLLRKANHITTAVYNSLLRTYKTAGKMPLIILERMKKDNVQPDHETELLLKSVNQASVGTIFSYLEGS